MAEKKTKKHRGGGKRLEKVEDEFVGLDPHARTTGVFDALARVGGVTPEQAKRSRVRKLVSHKRGAPRPRPASFEAEE